MKEVNNFLQRLLRLILSGNILEGYTGRLLYIDLRIGLTNAKGSAGTATHPIHEEGEEAPENQNGKNHGEDIIDHCESGICLLHINDDTVCL